MSLCKSANLLMGLHVGEEHPWSSPHRRRSIRYLPGESFRIFDGLPLEKIDVGSLGVRDRFHRDMLRLCTENVGSESCEGTLEPEEEAALEAAAADEKAAEAVVVGKEEEEEELQRPVSRRREGRREIPPPLRWMANGDGRSTGFMKAVREGGRLILREVRIERPEVLRATREDGRLRLHVNEADPLEARHEETGKSLTEPTTKEEEEEEEKRWEWQRGEGLSRCQEAASGNRQVPAWWNHRFATMA